MVAPAGSSRHDRELRSVHDVNRIIGTTVQTVAESAPPDDATTGVSPGDSFVMVPMPSTGRVFTEHRRVRLGDVDPEGRLRLDALTRYTQDVSNDDTMDVALPDDLAFVVRRTTVDVHRSGALGEDLTIRTFCGRLGRRWAERRLVVEGSAGAHYEVATLWVHIDVQSGRPRPLSEDFLHHYAEAAQGLTVSARHQLQPPERTSVRSVERTDWPLRIVDFDTFAHMNNAAYWAVIEEFRHRHPTPEPLRASIEYGAGIGPADLVVIAHGIDDRGRQLLWWEIDGQPSASAAVGALGGRGANTAAR